MSTCETNSPVLLDPHIGIVQGSIPALQPAVRSTLGENRGEFETALHPSAQMLNILGNSDSPQVKLVNEWGQGFEKRDIGLIAKVLHKDYRHITYPRSLGRPEQTREEWLQHIAGVINIRGHDETIVHSVIDIPGKLIVHFTNKVKTSIGVETSRESIYIMQFVTDEDGTLKLKQAEDFTDSKAYLDFVQDIAAAKANKEKRSYAA